MSLITFKFGNFRSYKEDFGITFETINSKKSEENYHFCNKKKLLNSAIIYGANASGKSNLLKAFNVMKKIVLGSVKREENDQLPVESFLLDLETYESPSFFEITVFVNNHQYRYGFETTKKVIKTEWFFWIKNVRESRLFLREDGKIINNNSEFEIAKVVKKIVPKNALLLTEAARYIHENKINHARIIMDFFRSLTFVDNNRNIPFGFGYSAIQILKELSIASQIRTAIQKADFGILDILAEEEKEEKTPEHVVKIVDLLSPELDTTLNPKTKRVRIKTTHQLFEEGKKLNSVKFDMDIHESDGTRKFFAIIGPIFEILKKGALLFIDEFDTSLHPELSHELIKLFHSRKTNPNGAQLIITSHNSEFLRTGLFRRDQIWFVEKHSNGESVLYPLTDFKIKNQDKENIANLYRNGRFGAIPYLHGLYDLFASENGEKITSKKKNTPDLDI